MEAVENWGGFGYLHEAKDHEEFYDEHTPPAALNRVS
jgi:hypothetical protein